MKKLSLILIFFACYAIINSQTFNIQSARNYWEKGKLDKAKTAIDAASLDAKTSTWAKTWYYRGDIYYDIYYSKDKAINKLDSNALGVAYDSYKQALKLDEKKEFADGYFKRIMSCYGQYYYTKGVEYFNRGVKSNDKKEFNNALIFFRKTIAVGTNMKQIDTNAIYNAALSAERCDKTDSAIYFYSDLVKLQPRKVTYFINLQKNYKRIKDTAKALETIQQGLKLHPDNLPLIIEETNIYLAKGQTEKAQNNLLKAVEKDPNNPTLYYVIGNTYDKMYADTANSIYVRLNALKQAEDAYRKAIMLNPNYTDANYNIAALYYNEGVRLFEAADKIMDQAKYDAEKAKADDFWKKALPFCEKAYQMQPNDRNILISLKFLYVRTKQNDKAAEIDKKIKELKVKK